MLENTTNETQMIPEVGGDNSGRLKNKLMWVFGIFFLILLVISLYLYIGNTLKNKQIRELPQEQREAKMLEEDLLSLNDFAEKSSLENQKQYMEETDAKLADANLTEDTKMALLLRKAAVMSVVRSSDPRNTQKINTILNSLISNKIDSDTDLYVRDFATVIFLRLNFQNRTANDVGSVFPETIKKYRDQGYNETLSTLLSLNEIVSFVSPERKDDNSLVAISLLIKSEIISVYSKDLKPGVQQSILENLKRDLALFKNTKLKTFKNPYNTTLESSLYYAYAYDTYNSTINKSISKEINEEIDRNYEEVFLKLKNSTYDDRIGTNTMYIYNSMRYTTSLNKRYGSNIEKDKLDTIIKDTLEAINYSKETKETAGFFIKENFNKGQYANWSYFISLGKTRDDVHKYLNGIGIDIRK